MCASASYKWVKMTPEREKKRGVRVMVRRLPAVPSTCKSKGRMEQGRIFDDGFEGRSCVVATLATRVGEEESNRECHSHSGAEAERRI
jgi:hypothetical protein